MLTDEEKLIEVAQKMVGLQSFDFKSFQDARQRVEFEFAGGVCFVEFDSITLYRYCTNLSQTDYGVIYRNLEKPLRMKLSR